MPRISKRYLHKDIEDHLINLLCEYFSQLKTPSSVKEFLESIFSDTEKIMIAKRLGIAMLLSRGSTFDIIDNKLKVSKSTIAGVHHQISSGAIGYQKAVIKIEEMLKSENNDLFITEVLLKLTPGSVEGSSKHHFKSVIGKDLYKRKKQRSVI